MISPCVGFANKPFSANFKHTSHAEIPFFSLILIAFNKPFPLTKVIQSDLMFRNSVLKISPKACALSANFSSKTTSIAEIAILQPNGFPP